MPVRIETGNLNELMKKLLLMQYEEQMSNRMSDYRARQQNEYLERSNELTGQRQQEYIKAQGAKEKEMKDYQRGLDREKLADENTIWLLKQSPINQLRYGAMNEQDPEKRKTYSDLVGGIADVFGSLTEEAIMGKPPDRERLSLISKYVDVNDAITYFNGLSTSYGRAETQKTRRESTAISRERLNLEGEKPGKADPELTALNNRISARAKVALSKVEDLGLDIGDEASDVEMGETEEAQRMLPQMVLEIQNRADMGEFDKATAKEALDILTLVQSNPTKVVQKAKAKDWLKKTEARRGVTKTATNPQTGEKITFRLVNGQWIRIQ